jgi:hypothetical protein
MICGSDEILDLDGSSARNAPLARDGISRTRVLQSIRVNYPSRVGSSARMDPQLGMISHTQVLQGIRVNYPSRVGSLVRMDPQLGMVSRVLGCYKVSGSTTRVGWLGWSGRLGPNDFDGL